MNHVSSTLRDNRPLAAAEDVIPGGAHTYSKGPDQFPAIAPKFLERGDGATVWDEEDRSYLDWTMGLRAMSLGYRCRPVIEAAVEQMWRGSNFGKPSSIEVEFAEELIDLIPSAEMCKFAKNGSTVTTAAVKLARAYTGRDYVAFCQEHPFFSYDDWFIGATPCNAGIPKAFAEFSLPFHYDDIASLERQFAAHPGQIAAVILEPANVAHPRQGFLAEVAALCRREGAVLIFDEMITGFRWDLRGAQHYYGVAPDLSTFGKGMGNGFAVAALVGARDIMELGGLRHDQRRVFLISTTHGAENHALAAARAALGVFREQDVVGHLWRIGELLIDGLNAAAKDAGVAASFSAGGVPCSPWFACRDREGAVSLGLRTLFLQEMLRRGVIANYLAPSFAHGVPEVERTVAAARECLDLYARALDEGWERHLVGRPIKPVFRPYNEAGS
jgi:glutamate-1-semialdehyde 2,1-aminomutase